MIVFFLRDSNCVHQGPPPLENAWPTKEVLCRFWKVKMKWDLGYRGCEHLYCHLEAEMIKHHVNHCLPARQWINPGLGWPERDPTIGAFILWDGRKHLSAEFGGGFEMEEFRHIAVTQSVFKCSLRRRHSWSLVPIRWPGNQQRKSPLQARK